MTDPNPNNAAAVIIIITRPNRAPEEFGVADVHTNKGLADCIAFLTAAHDET